MVGGQVNLDTRSLQKRRQHDPELAGLRFGDQAFDKWLDNALGIAGPFLRHGHAAKQLVVHRDRSAPQTVPGERNSSVVLRQLDAQRGQPFPLAVCASESLLGPAREAGEYVDHLTVAFVGAQIPVGVKTGNLEYLHDYNQVVVEGGFPCFVVAFSRAIIRFGAIQIKSLSKTFTDILAINLS